MKFTTALVASGAIALVSAQATTTTTLVPVSQVRYSPQSLQETTQD